jgi:phosphoglycerol transferase MdoB-like AlkP superfamily enzyme
MERGSRPKVFDPRLRNSADWLAAAVSTVPWIVPAFTGLYLKRVLLIGDGILGGFQVLGRLAGTSNEQLTRSQNLFLYRYDLLVGFVLLPALLVLSLRLLPRTYRVAAAVFLSAGVTGLLYVQRLAFLSVGRFLPLTRFISALQWGIQESGAARAYLSPPSLLALMAAVLAIAGLAIVCRHWVNAIYEGISGACRKALLLTKLSLAFALLLPVAWAPRLPHSSYDASALTSALEAYFQTGALRVDEFEHLSREQLAQRYRRLTHTPAPTRDHYWGAERGANLLIIVLETAPARCLSLAGSLEDVPNLKRLRERAFIALNHHTTYPYTSSAVFSLLSSWYPSNLAISFERQFPGGRLPSLFWSLAGAGYETATYAALRARFEPDEAMYGSLGVQRQIFSSHPAVAQLMESGTTRAEWQTKAAMDEDVLGQLEADIARASNQGRAFAYVFLPIIGHAPWDDITGGESNVVRRGRAIIALQDAWLGELMGVLDRHHQLDNTLVIVVADHGIRTRIEDPDLPQGMIDDYSFHVPLLLYAPHALERTETIPWVTSHIDLAPSILDLMGIEAGRGSEQGLAMWNPALADRISFLFANYLLGADGFCSKTTCSMWNRVFDTVYVSPGLHFAPDNLAPPNSQTYFDVSTAITRMEALQQVWGEKFITRGR